MKQSRLALALLALIACGTLATAQDCLDFADLTGWQSATAVGPQERCDDVAAAGHLVCVAAREDGLHVFDTSGGTPERTAVVTLINPVSGVVLDGTRAYAMHVGVMTVIDLDDPANPVQRGWVSLPDRCEYGTLVAGYLYTFDGDQFAVIDVSDPDAPTAVHTGTLGGYGSSRYGPEYYAYGFVQVGDHLLRSWTGWAEVQEGPDWWVIYPVGCLDVIDVSDPAAPAWVSSPLQDLHQTGEGLHAVGDRVYQVRNGHLVTLDCSDPAAPVTVAELAGTFHDLVTVDGQLYATATFGLALLDPQPDGSVAVVIDYPVPLPSLSHAVAGPDRILTNGSYGFLLQYTIGAAPADAAVTTVGELALPDETDLLQQHVCGDLAVAYRNDGDLVYIDLAAPGGPVVAGTITMPGTPAAVALDETRAVVAMFPVDMLQLEIVVVDHTDPSAPVIASWAQLPVTPFALTMDIELAGDMAYLAVLTNGLLPIDITDPYTPVIGAFVPGLDSGHLAIADGYLYQLRDDLYAYDLTDPFAPTEAGMLVLGANGSHVLQVEDTTAYVVGSFHLSDWPYKELRTIDVSDPAAMVQLGWHPIFYDHYMRKSGDLIYIGGDGALQLLDVADPAAPLQVGVLPGQARCPIGHDASLYVINGGQCWQVPPHCDDPVSILPPDEDTPPVPQGLSLTAAPNPFNPRLTVSFALDRAQSVTLDVYDLRGRRVSRLAAGTLAAGGHQVSWNGCDAAGRSLPSGSYLLVLGGESRVATRKVALVR